MLLSLKQYFLPLAVNRKHTDLVYQHTDREIPLPLNRLQSDMYVLYLNFNVIQDPDDVLLHEGVRISLFLFKFHLYHLGRLVDHLLESLLNIELIIL